MANPAAQGAQVVNPYPAPPSYAQAYTTERIAKNDVPNPPPVPEKFTIFGEEHDFTAKLSPSLPELGLQQLYSSNASYKNELKKLNRSAVAAFLDLLEILIRSPDHPERREKLETIRMIFINMHHIINEHRPVQARDLLKHMMVKQNKEIKSVNEKLRNHITVAAETFRRVHQAFGSSYFDNALIKEPSALTHPPERT